MLRGFVLKANGELRRWVFFSPSNQEALRAPPEVSSVLQWFEEIPSLDSLRSIEAGDHYWFDLAGADSALVEEVGRVFAFHPLAIEDCLHADQRPKVEEYAGHSFVVMHGFEWSRGAPLVQGATPNEGANPRFDIEAQVRELHCFVTHQGVVTVHAGRLRSIEKALLRWAQDRRGLPARADELLHRILDDMLEEQPRYLDYLDEEIEALDQQVLSLRSDREAFENVHHFQKQLNQVRRILNPQKDVLLRLSESPLPEMRDQTRPWFRDLHDHSVRVHSQLENLRENLWTIRDAHLGMAAHRTNEAMRRLTVFSVIFLPLTFLTGFFGMNFEGIPYGNQSLLLGLISLVVALPAFMVLAARRGRWW